MKQIVSLVLLSLVLFCHPAMALDLSTAKAQGLVGETATGYLAPVKTSPEVQQLVETINGKRRAHYQKISKGNNTSLDAVEKLAGEKAMEKTPAGQYIQEAGAWKKNNPYRSYLRRSKEKPPLTIISGGFFYNKIFLAKPITGIIIFDNNPENARTIIITNPYRSIDA